MGLSVVVLCVMVIIVAVSILLDYLSIQHRYPHSSGLQGWKEYWEYCKQEWRYEETGDSRDEFEKVVTRCHVLRSSRIKKM